MKTVIISLYEVIPTNFGGARVAIDLFNNFGKDTTLIQVSNKKSSSKDIINIKLNSTSRFEKFTKMFQVCDEISKQIKTINPNLIIFEGSSWAVYYYILLKKIKKISKAKIIYHAHNVEYILRKQKENLTISLTTKIFESKLCNESDKLAVVSEEDGKLFKKIYNVDYILLPNSVETKRFNLNKNELKKIEKKYSINKNSILFMGMPAYKPNAEAINIIINDILPKVLKEIPTAKFFFIGGNINSSKKGIFNPGQISEFDLNYLIKSCNVCIAPIISGSGTRLKILEYMAAGRPVVSTTKGAEGINIKKESIIISDDFYNFSKEIIKLLKNKKLQNKIGKLAKKEIEEKYSWKVTIKNFKKEIQKIL
jgi:glycosyltransferase involved in cell wall biosynthesis